MILGLLAWPTVADKQKTSELPAMAFLEFLAEMEEVDGKLVSASDLLELNQQAAATKGKTSEEQLAILKLFQEPQAIEKKPTGTDGSLLTSDQVNSNTTKKEEDK